MMIRPSEGAVEVAFVVRVGRRGPLLRVAVLRLGERKGGALAEGSVGEAGCMGVSNGTAVSMGVDRDRGSEAALLLLGSGLELEEAKADAAAGGEEDISTVPRLGGGAEAFRGAVET